MRLLSALQQCENQLRTWQKTSASNTRLLNQDPAAALEAANLGLDRETMVEFEDVLRALARKLDLKVPGRVA